MKLKIKKEEILKGLQRIQGVVEKKNTMPILSNMLLTADSNGVEIVATDLEIGLRGRYAAEVEKPGAVTVSAKKMYEIVRELPAEDIQIKVEDGNWVKIISGQSQFKLVALPKDEYPALPDVAEEGMIAIEGETLREMIKKTLYSVGENDARYVLNGLFVHMTPGEGRPQHPHGRHRRPPAVHDRPGHRRQAQGRKHDHPEEGDDGAPAAARGGRSAAASCGSDSARTMRCSSATAWSWSPSSSTAIIPTICRSCPAKSTKKVAVSKDLFSHAVKRVSILSKEKTNAVKMQLEKDVLVLSTNNPEVGEASEELAVDYKGEAITHRVQFALSHGRALRHGPGDHRAGAQRLAQPLPDYRRGRRALQVRRHAHEGLEESKPEILSTKS